MNKKILKTRNEHIRLLDCMKRINRDCVKINAHNTDAHEKEKFNQCLNLAREGCSFVTEARFRTGGIADIFILDTGHVIEILATEKEKRFKEKIKKYPIPEHKIIKVKAGEVESE